MQAIYTEGVPEGVDCEHCEDEHYCSEECRKVRGLLRHDTRHDTTNDTACGVFDSHGCGVQVAWAHFHKSLCVGQDPSADHPMLKLEALARYRDPATNLPVPPWIS